MRPVCVTTPLTPHRDLDRGSLASLSAYIQAGARREDAPALALATPSRREIRYESARPEELSARIADGMAKVEKESQPSPVIITTSHTSQPLVARWRRGLAARSSSSSRASATAWAAWSSG